MAFMRERLPKRVLGSLDSHSIESQIGGHVEIDSSLERGARKVGYVEILGDLTVEDLCEAIGSRLKGLFALKEILGHQGTDLAGQGLGQQRVDISRKLRQIFPPIRFLACQ